MSDEVYTKKFPSGDWPGATASTSSGPDAQRARGKVSTPPIRSALRQAGSVRHHLRRDVRHLQLSVLPGRQGSSVSIRLGAHHQCSVYFSARVHAADSGLPSRMPEQVPFQNGFIMSLTALRGLHSMLQNIYGVKYFLTSRVNQDMVTNFFSQVRGLGAGRTHPTAVEAKTRVLMLDHMLMEPQSRWKKKNQHT